MLIYIPTSDPDHNEIVRGILGRLGGNKPPRGDLSDLLTREEKDAIDKSTGYRDNLNIPVR